MRWLKRQSRMFSALGRKISKKYETNVAKTEVFGSSGDTQETHRNLLRTILLTDFAIIYMSPVVQN